MRQISGGWRMEARREGAARFILKSAMGEEFYMDFSPDDLSTLRARLGEIPSPKSAPAETAEPETNEPAPAGKQRRAKA